MTALLPLAIVFATLSLLAFGGGNAVLPEMQRAIVVQHHWLTAGEFTALFGLAQAAPGPNLMIVTLLGWRLAGLPGALVATLATFLPATALTILVLRLWDRNPTSPSRRLLQRALLPLTAALVLSSALIMTRTAATSPVLLSVTLVSALLSTTTRLHPLLILGAGAAVGAALA
jgi:chromate transporter